MTRYSFVVPNVRCYWQADNHQSFTMKRTLRVAPVVLAVSLAACGGGDAGTEPANTLVIGGDDAGTTATNIYQMPTPNELFGLVRDLAGDGHKQLLSPASNADKFVSRSRRAINFGVYATDLVYASSFKLNVEVARYYLTTKKLAEGIGVSSAFTDADFVRLESNLTRGDSLEVISNAAYMRAYEKLQEEQMGPVLVQVLAGGWIESMHLVIHQIQMLGKSDALMARVAEQKVTLEHLISMMEPLADDTEVAAVRAELLALREIYDAVNVKRVPHQGRSNSGRMVLGDDITVELTDEKFVELAQAVKRLRDQWTAPENTTNA